MPALAIDMMRGLRLCCLLALLATAARAETPVPPERPRDSAPVNPGDDANAPPYQAKLERLAELMGTLSVLRDLCAAGDGTIWRDKMADLLASEGSTSVRRDRLAGAFNKGFSDYRIIYRVCTPAAEAVIQRSLAEGASLTRELAARYGN